MKKRGKTNKTTTAEKTAAVKTALKRIAVGRKTAASATVYAVQPGIASDAADPVKLTRPFRLVRRNKPATVKGAYLLDKNKVYVCGLRYNKRAEYITIMRDLKAKLEKEEIILCKSAAIEYLKSVTEFAEDI